MTRIPSMISISHRMSVQPRPPKRVRTSCRSLRPIIFQTVSSVPRSFVLFDLLYLPDLACRLLARPPVCVCVRLCVCPSIPRCPFSSLPRGEIGFMTLFSSFADDVYQQIARRKRCFVLRWHNGRPGLADPLRRERGVIENTTLNRNTSLFRSPL